MLTISRKDVEWETITDFPVESRLIKLPIQNYLRMTDPTNETNNAQRAMINAINNIQKNYPTSRVVVLANAPNQAEAFYAMSIGAQGYCHAYSEGELLKEVRTVVSHGGIWMGNDLLKQLIEITTSLVGNQPQQVSVLLHQLTKREQDVAIEAAKGLSNKEIARILDITERTVKAHLSSIFETLKAKDRLQLALMLNINHKK